MNICYLILFLNIIISVLHPIKHIPQIIHTLNTKKVEDLSKLNIISELCLNILSITSFLIMYIYMNNTTYILPIIIEKFSSICFVIIIFYLKNKYTINHNYEEIKPILQSKL
tara:strand:+ start:1174 stop:1509 length:336 start_codon:yes stop_codon:yes gene_type:complete